MNLTTRQQHQLVAAAKLCRETPDYKVGFFISEHFKRKAVIDFAMTYFKELGIEMIQHTNPCIYFANGSRIFLMRPEVTGWEGHKVWIDECVESNLKEHLKLRERLK